MKHYKNHRPTKTVSRPVIRRTIPAIPFVPARPRAWVYGIGFVY